MLKKFKQKISGKIIMLAAIFVIIALQFFYAKSVYAGTGNIVVDLIGSAIGGVLNIASAPIFMLLGTIVVGVSWLVGQISTLLVYLLFYVASYNSFIKEGIVGYGWVIVRDICNMFFILILLIIAFATILRRENYNAKKLLPKLLIMAVLINFSKTICGLAIDFSQVIMLTFVNGLNAGDSFFGHGALVNALGLNKLLSMKTAVIDTLTSAFATSANPMSVFGSLLFGLILLIIACIVVGIFTMVLMFRIVMLWILIILSPLAFLAMAIPAGAKYASQWTNEFTKYLIVGPAMAFFLWLALLLSQASFTTNFNLSQSIGAAKTGFDSQILTEMGNPQNLANFIVVIVFLLAGLMVAQQMGVAGGGMAGNAVAKIKATGIGAAKWGTFATGRKLDSWQVGAQKKIAGALGVKDYIPKSLNYRMVAAGWKAKQSKDLEDYESTTGGVNAWRDTFGKYLRISQYGAVRKSKKRQAEDNEKADKLAKHNRMMDDRVSNFNFSESAKDEKRQSLMKDEKNIINKYNNNGLNGEVEFNKDLASLSTYVPDADNIKDDYEKKIAKNKNEIQKLRDEKWFGFKGAAQYGGDYYKSGQTELQEKDERETMSRTDGQDHALISELLQALKTKDQNRTVSTLNILAKNNDINEALKDSRVIDLMARENGILQDLAKTMKLDQNQTTQLIKDFQNNPVTPAYAHALVQGALKATNMDNALAGRYAHKIGSSSFSAGNGLAFGMTSGNSATGNYEFDKLNFKDGALQTSQSRKDAIIGKFANLESQAKMRTVHPDVFIKEAQSGDATGLSEEGKDFIRSLTAHDLGQISRLRLDVIRKIGKSKPALRDIKLLAKDLEEQGDQNQANIVKYFAGYIKFKIEGKGELKDRDAAEKAFKEIEV